MSRIVMRRAIALIAALAAVGTIPSAGATTSGATIALSPSIGPPTTFTVITGMGFGPNETVDLSFENLAHSSVVTDGTGFFRARKRVPATALPGSHTVTAAGRTSGKRARAMFLVRTDWVQEGWTASHTSHNVYENVLDPSNVGDLGLKWLVTNVSANWSPTIAGGVVYAASGGDAIVALRASDGQQLWSTTLAGPSTPAVSHGLVYTGTFGDGHDGSLYALDANTGAIRWTRLIGGYIFGGPTVANGFVYTAGNGSVVALNANTGAEVWKTYTATLVGGVAVADGIAYVHSQGDSIVALDAATGKRVWKNNRIGYGFSVPVVSNGSVYVGGNSGGNYAMFAFDAGTGQELWETPFPEVERSAAVAYGLVYAGGGDGNLYAFDAETGAVIWTAPTGGEVRSVPAVANGVVYIWSGDNAIYAFDARTGENLWSWPLEGSVSGYPGPAVADGVLYLGIWPYVGSSGLYAFALNHSIPGARQGDA